MYGIIYKATFPNGKVYIGQTTKDLKQRIWEHNYYSKKEINGEYFSKAPFYKALRKIDFNQLKWEVIDFAENREELDEKEIKYIKEYNSCVKFKNSKGYNCDFGGKKGGNFGNFSEEILKELGKSIKEGKSKKYIIKTYNISEQLYSKLVKGRIWNQFTLIPKYDDFFEEPRSALNKYQVCKIMRDFKKHGNLRKIALDLEVTYPVVWNVIHGKTWSKLTGIIDDSFYQKYQKTESKYSKELLDEIITSFYDKKIPLKDLCEKYNIPHATMVHILNGTTLNNITHIREKLGNKKEREEITEVIVIKIREEYYILNERISDISKEMNIPYSTIDNIVKGRTWNQVTGLPKYEKHI